VGVDQDGTDLLDPDRIITQQLSDQASTGRPSLGTRFRPTMALMIRRFARWLRATIPVDATDAVGDVETV
jgi:hypothetical protein